MRIVSGRYGGHHLASVPRRGVRPTADPVREALFNILGARVIDRAFVDVAAGTGAVGLEALSRGARPVFLVERDRAALGTIARNLELLHIPPAGNDELRVVKAEAGAWLSGAARREVPAGVGVAFFDPPYGERRLPEWITALCTSELLDEDSLVVVEHRTGEDPEFPGLVIRWTRRYGDTSLTAASLPEDVQENTGAVGPA